MDYVLRCSCGSSLKVSDGAAGTSISCTCGKTVPVPSLAELRSQAGLLTQLNSAPQVIDDMIAAGKLPTRSSCAHCGVNAQETADIVAHWKTYTNVTSPSALNAALTVLWGVSPQSHQVDSHSMPFRIRLCPFCVGKIAGVRNWPAFTAIILLVFIVAFFRWSGFTVLALPVVAYFGRMGVGFSGRQREELIRKTLEHEPIYKQVLEREEFREATFEILRLPAKSAQQQWPSPGGN